MEKVNLSVARSYLSGMDDIRRTIFSSVCDELADLRENGSPGVMHEVDMAFYNLAINERDYERHLRDQTDRLLIILRDKLNDLRKDYLKLSEDMKGLISLKQK